jgi:hypothetical protein
MSGQSQRRGRVGGHRRLREPRLRYLGNSAHEESSRLERYYRRHPNELHQALVDEGWS